MGKAAKCSRNSYHHFIKVTFSCYFHALVNVNFYFLKFLLKEREFQINVYCSSSFFRFIVRDFVYDEESLKIGRNERDKLVQEKQRQYAPLVRWLKINFGEIFSAFVHVKALRVFVESVLRSVA